DFLDLWEWEVRVLDIELGSAEAWRPRCLGRDATARVRRSARVHANSGSARVVSARDRTGAGREGLAAHSGSTAGPGHRDLLKELLDQGLERAVQRLKEYAQFQPDRFSQQEVNDRLVRYGPYGRAS